MTLEAKLFALLSPLVAGRVFPDVAPFDTARPYIIWQQIGGKATNYVDDTVPDTENAAIQLTTWHDTRASAKAMALQIESTLITAATLQARPMSASVAEHEPDLNRYGARQDFDITASRTG